MLMAGADSAASVDAQISASFSLVGWWRHAQSVQLRREDVRVRRDAVHSSDRLPESPGQSSHSHPARLI